ncbi:MAG: DUF4256 domain-containing protein, partial [Prosthecobacter sp.]|nr:DUF4256 domain-containing protein [Prosthecobacter sp.]
MRDPGGELYGERRYDCVFAGHNGVPSCYAVRQIPGGAQAGTAEGGAAGATLCADSGWCSG